MAKRKRTILYLCGSGTIVGGGQISLRELVRRLDRSRFQPVAAVGSSGDFIDALRIAGCETLQVPLPPLRSWRLGQALRSIRVLVDCCKQRHIALLHANDSRAHAYAGIVSLLIGVPAFFHYRVSLSDGLWDRIMPFLCTRLIAVSRSTAARFPYAKSRTVVIPNGVDASLFSPGVRRSLPAGVDADCSPIIGSIGRLEPIKGMETVIDAAALIKKRHAGLGLVIVGKGDPAYAQSLRRRMEAAGLTRNTVIIDAVDDVPGFMRSLDLYLLLSSTEALNRTLLEAMASAKPVVATSVGGNPEVVDEKTGRLVPFGDAEAAARAAMEILGDRDLSLAMGAAAREKALGAFSLEKHVECIEKLYEACALAA